LVEKSSSEKRLLYWSVEKVVRRSYQLMYDNAAFRSPFGNYDTLAKAVTNLLSPKELLFLHINSNARVVSAVTEKQHGAWMPRSSPLTNFIPYF